MRGTGKGPRERTWSAPGRAGLANLSGVVWSWWHQFLLGMRQALRLLGVPWHATVPTPADKSRTNNWGQLSPVTLSISALAV